MLLVSVVVAVTFPASGRRLALGLLDERRHTSTRLRSLYDSGKVGNRIGDLWIAVVQRSTYCANEAHSKRIS